MKVPWIVQRIYCIAPFAQSGDILIKTWIITAYSYSVIIVYLVCLFWLLSLTDDIIWSTLVANGYVSFFITLFDFCMGKISLVILIVMVEYQKNDIIRLYANICAIDEKIKKKLHIYIDYKRICIRNCLTVAVTLFYYYFLVAIGFMYLIKNFGITRTLLLVIPYHFEMAAIMFLTLSYVNCMQLICDRFQILQNLTLNVNSPDIESMLVIYRELIEVTAIFAQYSGFFLILRCGHDFLLSTMASYVMISVLIDSTCKWELLYGICMLFFQTNIKLLLITIFGELTKNKVSTLIGFQ